MGSKSGAGKKKRASTPRKPDPEPSSDIRCVCGNNVDRGMMIQCETCLLWQHGACYGMKKDEDIPEHYFCEICRPDLHPSSGPEPMDESPLEADGPSLAEKKAPEARARGGSATRSRSSTKSPARSKAAKKAKTPAAKDNNEVLVSADDEVVPELEFVSSEKLRKDLSKDLVLVRDLVKAKSRNKLGVLSASVGRELLEKYALMFAADEHCCDGKDFVRALAFVLGFEPIRLIDYLMRLAEEVRNNEDNFERYCGDPTDPFSGWKIEEDDEMPCNESDCNCSSVYGIPERVELSRSPADQKWSLCAISEASVDDFLIQYRGVVGEAAGIMRNVRRSRSYLLDHDVPYIEYTMLGEEMIGVDARKQGNIARFVRRSCKPNAELRAMQVHGSTVLVLVATQALQAGSEVTVGYPFEPKGTLKSSAPCACPKQNCNVAKWYTKRREVIVKELQGIEQFRVFASLQSSVAAVAPSVSAVRDPDPELPRPQTLPAEQYPTPANLETSLNPYSTPQGKMSREERKIMQYMRSFEKMENRGGKKRPGEQTPPPSSPKPRATTPKKKTPPPKKVRQTPPSGPRLPAKRTREEKVLPIEIVSPKKRKPTPSPKKEAPAPVLSKGLASSPFPKIRRTVSQETCLAKLSLQLEASPKLPIGKVGKKAYLMYKCSQGPGNGAALVDHGDYVKPHNAKKLLLHKFMAVKRNKGGSTRISLHSSSASTGSDSIDGLSPVLDPMDTSDDASPQSPSFQTFEQTRKNSSGAVETVALAEKPKSPEFTLKPPTSAMPSPVLKPSRAPATPPVGRGAPTPAAAMPSFQNKPPAPANGMPEFKQKVPPMESPAREFRRGSGDVAMPDFKPRQPADMPVFQQRPSAGEDMPDFRKRPDTEMMYSSNGPPAAGPDYGRRMPPGEIRASQGPPMRQDLRNSFERPSPVAMGRGQPFDRPKPRGWDVEGPPGPGRRDLRSPAPGVGRDQYSSPGGMYDRSNPSPRMPGPVSEEEPGRAGYYGGRRKPGFDGNGGGPVMQYSGAGVVKPGGMPHRGRGGPTGWGQPPSRTRPDDYGPPPYAGRGRPYVSAGQKGDAWRR